MDEQNEHAELQMQLSSLKPIYRSAIELRLIGMQYKVIAEKLTAAGYKVKEHTLRVWFMQGGVCSYHYTAIQQQRAGILDIYREEMKLLLGEAALDAIATLREGIAEGSNITRAQINAAIAILDRAGFPKEKGILVKHRYETEKEDIEAIAHKVKELIRNEIAQT